MGRIEEEKRRLKVRDDSCTDGTEGDEEGGRENIERRSNNMDINNIIS